MAFELLFLCSERKWRPPRNIRQKKLSFKSTAEGIILCERPLNQLCRAPQHSRKCWWWGSLMKGCVIHGTFQPTTVELFRASRNLTWGKTWSIFPTVHSRNANISLVKSCVMHRTFQTKTVEMFRASRNLLRMVNIFYWGLSQSTFFYFCHTSLF